MAGMLPGPAMAAGPPLAGEPPPPAPPPDIFYAGVSSLADQLDKVVLIVLRDGRHLLGRLTSYDQYGSLVLEDSKERHFAGGKYADVHMGMYLIRGENVVLLCEVDPAREGSGRSGPYLVEAPFDEVQALEQKAKEDKAAAAGATVERQGWGMGPGAAEVQ